MLDRVSGNFHVGINQGHVPALGFSDANIIAFGKTEVLPGLDELNAGKFFLHHFGTAIGGGIVHNDDLRPEFGSRPLERDQALAQEIPGVPADDHDRKVEHGYTSMADV